MRLNAVLAGFNDLDRSELTLWIDYGWVRPEPMHPDDWHFEEIDLARLRLIYELRRHCEVGLDLIPMILALLDQVYDLRSTLSAVSKAIETQPAPIRQNIAQALKTRSSRSEPLP